MLKAALDKGKKRQKLPSEWMNTWGKRADVAKKPNQKPGREEEGFNEHKGELSCGQAGNPGHAF